MADICDDNRFEIIAKAKKALLECTNIDMCADEMAVIDNILFRCWQMGWLDRYDTADTPQNEGSEQMSVLIRGMDMPKHCFDCPMYKSFSKDSDGYGEFSDYCGALKRRFNQDKYDINPFKQKLSDCPLIEVADTPQAEYPTEWCESCELWGADNCRGVTQCKRNIEALKRIYGIAETEPQTETSTNSEKLQLAVEPQTDCGWK